MNSRKYDLWSDGYGAPIHLLNDNDEYPVAGYGEVLNEVYNMVRQSDARKILDVGFGTGILTRKLYADGYTMYGVDSSEQMVEAGRECMPNANLLVADCSMGMPLKLIHEEFDTVLSIYAFHRLDQYEKRDLIQDFLRQLKDGGQIIIGDLAFASREEMRALRKANKDNWLYEDMYMVYDELKKDFEHVTWKKISKCAGIIVITK